MDKIKCLHCGRDIDASARLCVYCNRYRDERQAARAAAASNRRAPVMPVAPSRAKRPRSTSSRVLFGLAAVALLIATMVVGAVVVSFQGRDRTPAKTAAAQAKLPDKLQPSFVTVPENDPTSTIGAEVTPDPVPDPDHRQAGEDSDATAATSVEYARIMQTQTAVAPRTQTVDPRTVSGGPVVNVEAPRTQPVQKAPAPRPAPVRLATARVAGHRTYPQPVYQPVPPLERELAHGGTMRFVLTVGADGRVKEIEVLQTIPGKTAKMISAVQRWRFEPATLNGRPVAAEFPVDIAFNPAKRG